ncbi:MAG: hypothetical protein GWN86_16735 [Desulfobacterales bacterium]|nr:hypothetical protein [Desulfobacterales bacterium]
MVDKIRISAAEMLFRITDKEKTYRRKENNKTMRILEISENSHISFQTIKGNEVIV